MPPKPRTTRNSNTDAIPIFPIEIRPERRRKVEPKKEEIVLDDAEPGPILDINAAEYEVRMTSNIRKIIACEAQFTKTMAILRDAKHKALAKKRQEVHDGTAEEFLDRKKELEAERDRQCAKVMQWYNLEIDKYTRKVEEARETCFSRRLDNKFNQQEKLIEKLEQQERVVLERIAAAQEFAAMTKVAFRNQTVEQEAETRTKKKPANYGKIDMYRRMLKYPIVVYQLTDQEVEEDMRFFEEAIYKKKIKDTVFNEKNIEAATRKENPSRSAQKKFSIMGGAPKLKKYIKENVMKIIIKKKKKDKKDRKGKKDKKDKKRSKKEDKKEMKKSSTPISKDKKKQAKKDKKIKKTIKGTKSTVPKETKVESSEAGISHAQQAPIADVKNEIKEEVDE